MSIIPENRRKTYDMRRLINLILDNDSFFEIGRLYGSSLITGLARMNGYSVAILANDCKFYAGAMTDASQSRKFVISLTHLICL